MKVQSTIKTGTVFEIDFDLLPEVSREAVIRYGFQRWVNDRVNSTTKSKGLVEKDDVEAYAESVIQRLREGEIGAQRTSAVRDPFIETQTRIVQEILRNAKGVKFKDSAAAIKAKGLEKFKEALGANDIEKEAKKRLANVRKLKMDGDIDLEELLK